MHAGVSGVVLAGLFAGISSIVFLVGWVGWRFFLSNPGVFTVGTAAAEHPEISQERPRSRCEHAHCSSSIARYSLMAVLVGGAVTFGVFSVSGAIAPEPLSIQEWARQAHIQDALNPEKLVPPPAYPPSFFVGSERQGLETADRDWSRLDPLFLQSVLRLLERLEGRGFTFALLEGYRSPERQERLAEMGSHVTNARAYQSKHQFGQAADLAPVRDGRLVISERDPWAMKAYLALGEETEKAGLTWGGRWWFKDYGHVEVLAK